MPNDPKLIKRTTTTTTEEFADDLDVDDLDGLHEDDECEPGSKGTDKADEQRSRRKEQQAESPLRLEAHTSLASPPE